jgi:methionine-rich copper-binding protein CopC
MVTAMSMTGQTSIAAARLAFAFVASAVLPPVGAFAHAFLDHANPLVGSTVHGSPAEVRIWFTQELEPAFSNVRVVDQNGAQVDRQNKAVEPSDRTQLKVSLPTLPPGKYKVFWHALSVDTHTTEGTFTFEVVP